MVRLSASKKIYYEMLGAEYTARNKSNDFILFLAKRVYTDGGIKMISFRSGTYSISEDRILWASLLDTGPVDSSFAEISSKDFYYRLLKRHAPTYKTKWMETFLGRPVEN